MQIEGTHDIPLRAIAWEGLPDRTLAVPSGLRSWLSRPGEYKPR